LQEKQQPYKWINLGKNGIIFYKARNIVITSIDKLKDEIAEVV